MTAAHSSQRALAGYSAASSTHDRMLEENAFRTMISLERKRTERSNQPFLLMLLESQKSLQGTKEKQEIFRKTISALTPAIRETDVVGWYENSSALGIIFTGLSRDHHSSIPGTLLARVSGILYGILPFEEYNQITFSHYLFPEEWDHDVPQRPSHPTLYPDLSERDSRKRLFRIAKRTMDVAGSAIALIVGSPLFLGIALAIKLSSRGPVLFRQTRVGQYGKPFVFLKFRSMYADNDRTVHEEYVKRLISGKVDDATSETKGRTVYKLTNDPRITRVGLFLRRTSLDELPQLYHVLVGDMSLVGPRPPLPYEVKAYEVWHRRRVLEAKPGLTGLWQVNGRSRVRFDDMVRLDVRYAAMRSLWVDLKILLQTPRAILMGDGAF